MTRARLSLSIVCGCAALLLAACHGLSSRTSEALGGNWREETRSASLGAERNFQWLLFRKHPSALVEADLHDVHYCGDDCVLYSTARKGIGLTVHFRAACGDRLPVLFVPEGPSNWRIKDCGLQLIQYAKVEKSHDSVETYKDLFSRDEIKKRALAQPKAALRRKFLKLEYVDLTKGADSND